MQDPVEEGSGTKPLAVPPPEDDGALLLAEASYDNAMLACKAVLLSPALSKVGCSVFVSQSDGRLTRASSLAPGTTVSWRSPNSTLADSVECVVAANQLWMGCALENADGSFTQEELLAAFAAVAEVSEPEHVQRRKNLILAGTEANQLLAQDFEPPTLVANLEEGEAALEPTLTGFFDHFDMTWATENGA